MKARTIHLVFKTHLDIGFTDHAEKIRRLYHERFIPQAIETGEHFLAEDPQEPKFVWTTGAWLIADHLETRSPSEVRRLEAAIAKGVIRWHGLPFTTHTELMSPALIEAGLSYARDLDRRFGRRTIAAKMTDVPGHTLGLVPVMARAGLKFLHLGVNSASPVPDVPDVFRWCAPGGEEIVVMYQNSYGATHLPKGLEDALGFAHTNDNAGPPAIHQAVEAHRAFASAHPGARIRASGLDEYGEILWAHRESLPVVETEIGDSWVHGAASDPVKTARFRALQRLHDAMVEEGLDAPRRAFGRGLALVAEHTWGVDVKTFLRDETAWDRADFEAARGSDYRFSYCEASWAEQRAYLDAALGALSAPDRTRAEAALAELEPPPPPGAVRPLSGAEARVGGWRVRLDPETGDILELVSPDGVALQGGASGLIGFRHESYDAADMAAHRESYLVENPEWALLDHDKPGLEAAKSAVSGRWAPRLLGIAEGGGALVVAMEMAPEAHEALGAPDRLEYRLAPVEGGIEISLVLRAKPANRMPEAGFFGFTPAVAADWRLLKTGLWHETGRIARRGGGQLQAVFGARCMAGGVRVEIEPLDTPLAGPAGQRFMRYEPGVPDFSSGLRFCLYNNKWGTNFPMWWEGDLLARFALTLSP